MFASESVAEASRIDTMDDSATNSSMDTSQSIEGIQFSLIQVNCYKIIRNNTYMIVIITDLIRQYREAKTLYAECLNESKKAEKEFEETEMQRKECEILLQ